MKTPRFAKARWILASSPFGMNVLPLIRDRGTICYNRKARFPQDENKTQICHHHEQRGHSVFLEFPIDTNPWAISSKLLVPIENNLVFDFCNTAMRRLQETL